MTMTEVLNESNPLATLIAESYVDKPEYYLEIADGGLGFDFQVNKRLDVLGQLLNQSIWDIGSISNEIAKKSKKYTQRSTCLILIEEKTPFSHKIDEKCLSEFRIYTLLAKIVHYDGVLVENLIPRLKQRAFKNDVDALLSLIKPTDSFSMSYIVKKIRSLP